MKSPTGCVSSAEGAVEFLEACPEHNGADDLDLDHCKD